MENCSLKQSGNYRKKRYDPLREGRILVGPPLGPLFDVRGRGSRNCVGAELNHPLPLPMLGEAKRERREKDFAITTL